VRCVQVYPSPDLLALAEALRRLLPLALPLFHKLLLAADYVAAAVSCAAA